VGCAEIRPPDDRELGQGYILLLPGEEGADACAGLVGGLRDGGATQAIDLDMWGHRRWGMLPKPIAPELGRQEAARLAGKIATYHRDHPNAPISIIGYSYGGAVAVFTAETLPDRVSLDQLILVAPALSPQYDLGKAIGRSRHGVVNYYSEADWMTSSVSMRTLGTMDGHNTPSAGYIGFQNLNEQLLKRPGLEQIPWTRDWGRLGHAGNHAGWLVRGWVRQVLAPRVRLTAAPQTQPAGGPRP
jgi:pimeloyl-ACP methyl ester carboxylesterase